MPNPQNLEPYKWPPGKSGNPKGMKPGTKHISTWIQEMLHQKIDFKVLAEGRGKTRIYKTFSGMPMQAIIAVAIHQSMLGDKDAREWLAKHGYGTKTVLEFEDPIEGILEKYGLKSSEPPKAKPTAKKRGNVRKAKTTKARPPKDSK